MFGTKDDSDAPGSGNPPPKLTPRSESYSEEGWGSSVEGEYARFAESPNFPTLLTLVMTRTVGSCLEPRQYYMVEGERIKCRQV